MLPAGSTEYIHGVGWLGAVFFGLCTLIGVTQLFRSGPALIIDRLGIVDQTSWTSPGRIHWLEIRGFRVVTIRETKFLMVHLHNPRQYIDQGNVLRRFLRASRARMFGSPIALSSATLDIGFDDLVRTMSQFFDQATSTRA